MSRVFWDTNLFIYLLEGSGPQSARVTEIRERMLERDDDLCTSTLTLGEAKLPCIADVPPLKNVLVETPTGPTPFGGKQIAENPNVPTAAAIANAIADATGVRIFDLPLTAEKIYWALQQKRN